MLKILLVPGWTYTEEKISPLWQKMRDNGYAAELLKVPGLTGEKLKEAWSLADYARWLENEVERIDKQDDLILIGHSNGGRIILKFLSKEINQKRVKKVILLDSAGLVDKRWHKVLKRDLYGVGARLGKQLTKNEKWRKIVYKVIGERDYYVAEPVMRATMAKLIEEDLRTELQKIKVPMLLVWGSEDKMTPVCLAKEMVKKLPRAELKMIKGARHTPQFTHLPETWAIVETYLKDENGKS